MAGRDYPQFFGPSYRLSDAHAGVERSINCFPERLDTGLDSTHWRMRSAEGTADTTTLPGAVRYSFESSGGRWFVAAGSTLYEMARDGTSATVRGTLNSSIGPVCMDDNTNQLAIVDGAHLYILTLATNNFQRIVSAGWRGSDQVREIDGYFVFVEPGTQQFYLSQIDDGTLLDGLDFSSADAIPDIILSPRVMHRQLWLLGTLSSEIWVNSGGADFPFVRYNSYTVDVGVVGKDAAINAADTLFFIGKTERGTGIVYMVSGNQPRRISTLAIEEALRTSTDLSQATMWAYQTKGHEYIGINAPGLETTWVFDAALEVWHERAEWDGIRWAPLRWASVTAVGDTHYAADANGTIAEINERYNTLSGRYLLRERTWRHMVQPSLEPVRYFGLELLMLTGYGGQVMLEISNDGGKTFGPALMRTLGAIGRWMQRVRWLRLGASFNRVFRIRVSDNVPFAIHGAAVESL